MQGCPLTLRERSAFRARCLPPVGLSRGPCLPLRTQLIFVCKIRANSEDWGISQAAYACARTHGAHGAHGSRAPCAPPLDRVWGSPCRVARRLILRGVTSRVAWVLRTHGVELRRSCARIGTDSGGLRAFSDRAAPLCATHAQAGAYARRWHVDGRVRHGATPRER